MTYAVQTCCVKATTHALSLYLSIPHLPSPPRLQKMCAASHTASRQPAVHRGVADTQVSQYIHLQFKHQCLMLFLVCCEGCWFSYACAHGVVSKRVNSSCKFKCQSLMCHRVSGNVMYINAFFKDFIEMSEQSNIIHNKNSPNESFCIISNTLLYFAYMYFYFSI